LVNYAIQKSLIRFCTINFELTVFTLSIKSKNVINFVAQLNVITVGEIK